MAKLLGVASQEAEIRDSDPGARQEDSQVEEQARAAHLLERSG